MEDEYSKFTEFKDRLYYARKKYFGFLVACVVFQLSLSLIILFSRGSSETIFSESPSVEIGFSRFVAAMVMHIIMNDEIFNGMKMIKYSLNHPWKFSNPRLAFAAGFL